jgi:hypothetical protein
MWHIKVIDKAITGIKPDPSDKITLQNYPSPFSGSTTINYSIQSSSTIELSIYNLLGNKLEVIETTTKAPGSYSLEWQATNLAQGIYLLQLKTGQQLITRKIILNK